MSNVGRDIHNRRYIVANGYESVSHTEKIMLMTISIQANFAISKLVSCT